MATIVSLLTLLLALALALAAVAAQRWRWRRRRRREWEAAGAALAAAGPPVDAAAATASILECAAALRRELDLPGRAVLHAAAPLHPAVPFAHTTLAAVPVSVEEEAARSLAARVAVALKGAARLRPRNAAIKELVRAANKVANESGDMPLDRPPVVVQLWDGVRQEMESLRWDPTRDALVLHQAETTFAPEARASPACLARSRFRRHILLRHGHFWHAQHARAVLAAAPEASATRPLVNLSLLGWDERDRARRHARCLAQHLAETGRQGYALTLNVPLRGLDSLVMQGAAAVGLLPPLESENLGGEAQLAAAVIAFALGTDAAPQVREAAAAKSREQLLALVKHVAAEVRGDKGDERALAAETLVALLEALAAPRRGARGSPGWLRAALLTSLLALEARLPLSINCRSGHDRTAVLFAWASALNSLIEAGHNLIEVHQLAHDWDELACVPEPAPQLVQRLRVAWTQNMLSMGIRVTRWNTQVPGFKVFTGYAGLVERLAGSQTPVAAFTATYVDLLDDDAAVSERVQVVHAEADGSRELTEAGALLFEGLAAVRAV